jgi:hypothetical protein
LITQTPPVAPPARSLRRVLGVVDRGPRPFGRAAAVSLATTALLTIAISVYFHPHRRIPLPQQHMIDYSVTALCFVAVLGLLSACWPYPIRAAVARKAIPDDGRAAIYLALTAWFPLLLVAVYYRARSTYRPAVHWLAFGYDDKRWESSLYLAAALAPMLLLIAAARVLKVARERPDSWRSALTAIVSGTAGPQQTDEAGESADVPRAAEVLRPHQAPRVAEASQPVKTRSAWSRFRTSWLSVPAKIATAAGIAYYFYGPPWYMNSTKAAIGYQEDVFLQGIQAISKGWIPYIGPAAEQYGPGAEFFSYLYMRHVSGLSVVGFRESWAVFEWLGATILFVAMFLALGYLRGLLATLLSALIYPALQLLHFIPHAQYNGFFGWANPLRYAGAISLILLLPAAIRRCPSWRGLTGAAFLGLTFGLLSYIAQENLIGGVAGTAAIAVMLLLTKTSGWRAVTTAIASALGGFLLVWLPILAFYAAHGVLGRFVYLYFMTPTAVAGGYSNTPFGGTQPTGREMLSALPWERMFHLLPLVLIVVALLAVFEFRPFRIAQNWTRERVLLVAATVTTILLYQGALLRSDEPHLAGTLEALPALIVVAATALPRLAGARRRATLVVAGLVLGAASFLLLPVHTYAPGAVSDRLEAPYLDRLRLAAAHTPPLPATLADQRVGAGLADYRSCCQASTLPMQPFIRLMNELHAIIGSRTTYVASFRNGYPGLIYFVADLTPAPIPLEPHTMVFNVPQRTVYLKEFKLDVLPKIQALVTVSLSEPEARLFLHYYRQAREIVLDYNGTPYYVLLSSGHAGKPARR